MRWRRLERQYVPWKQYETDSFLDRGGFWFRQGHPASLHSNYIDYTLAQSLRLPILKRSPLTMTQVYGPVLNIYAGGTKSLPLRLWRSES